MRHCLSAALIATALVAPAVAKLPPSSDEAKAKAAETAAKAAWTDKVGLSQLCKSMDRVADGYRKTSRTSGKEALAPSPFPPCTEPGPYASPITPAASKPLEASGAHSPPGTAVSPPSSNATSAELTAGPKK